MGGGCWGGGGGGGGTGGGGFVWRGETSQKQGGGAKRGPRTNPPPPGGGGGFFFSFITGVGGGPPLPTSGPPPHPGPGPQLPLCLGAFLPFRPVGAPVLLGPRAHDPTPRFRGEQGGGEVVVPGCPARGGFVAGSGSGFHPFFQVFWGLLVEARVGVVFVFVLRFCGVSGAARRCCFVVRSARLVAGYVPDGSVFLIKVSHAAEAAPRASPFLGRRQRGVRG